MALQLRSEKLAVGVCSYWRPFESYFFRGATEGALSLQRVKSFEYYICVVCFCLGKACSRTLTHMGLKAIFIVWQLVCDHLTDCKFVGY